MKNKFSSFLTQKGRWLTAILFLLTFSIGQMWGQDVTLADINYTQWDGTAMPANSGLSNSNTYYASNGTSRVATLVGKGCKLDDSSNQPTATGVSGSYEHYLRFGSSGNYLNITASNDLVKNAGETSYGKVRFLVSSQKNKTTDELAEVKIGETSLGKIYAFTSTSTCDWVEFDIPATVSKNATITLTRTTNTLFVWGIQIKTFTSSSSPVSVTGITLAPSSATIKVGKTVTLVPTITPSDATDKAVTWAVTSGSSYASVTDAGVVTGLAAGTAVVTATAHDGSGVTQTATITVEDCPTSGTLFSMTITDPDGTVYTDVTNAAPQLIGATYVGGKAYATSTSSSKRSPKITGDEFDFNVSSSSSVAVKVELDCPLAEGDIISFTSTHTKEFKIQKVAGTNLHQTSSLSLAIPSGSSLIDEDVFYVLCANSACSFSEINIIRPIYRTITLEYADGETPDGSLEVVDGTAATKPADPTWEHHRFDGWYDGSDPYDWSETVGGDLTLTAHWTQLYTVTYAAGDAGATGDAPTQADKAATETFKVAANTFELAGKVFDHWNDGSADYNPNDTYTVGTSNVTLTAVWRTPSTMYAITKGTHANGDFTIDPATQEAGGTVTLSATPAEDYLFSAWEVVKTEDASATGITVDANGQFEMPAYAVTVNATFVADTRAKILYVTSASTENDKLYAALKDDYNVKVVGPTSTETVTSYALVVLHESVTGSNYNATAVAAAKGGAVPVLNTKSYFYNNANTDNQRWNWGTPNAGKKTKGVHVNTGYCNITSHPLFNDLTPDENDSIIILSSINSDNKPIQPIGTFTTGKEGYTLANVPDGCAIHELTPAQRGVASGKYLLISVYNKDLNNLNANGQKLFQNAAAYLVSDETWTPVAGLTNAEIDATGNPFSEGATMTLTASATGATAATTYAWYKGATWSEAEAGGAIQAAKTAENSGHIYTKTAAAEDADKYWCVMVKSTGCEVTASVEVSVVSCTKPGTPANLAASNLAYTTADLSWDAADNSDGYKISIIKKDDESVIVDWTDNATTSYAATGLTQGTEYTFKVKAKGATGYCEFGLEATVDFTTTAPSVADLVTIADDYTFTPSATIAAGTLAEDNKLFASGANDCDYNGSGMRIKENRALAFNVNNGAKVKVTFGTNGDREMKLGTAMTGDDSKVYGHSKTSPVTFDVTADGVVYLTSTSDLRFTKMEIMYPHTVTYDLNGGTGDPVPTQASKYVGETFTAHDGVTGITAPSGQEFDKWKDQDNADVAASATYTMPAKNVTLTAQWRAETVKYTVTYDLDDYTAGVAPTETNKAAGDVFAIKAAPSRDGYAFMGWLCNIDAQTYQATDDYTMTAAPTTFTAVWKQEFQVTFNLKGHGDPIAPQDIVDGGKVTKPTDPEEMLYEFGGWYKETTLENEWDFDNDVVEDDVELFAKWTAFDGCVYLAPVASGDALAVGDNVNLKTGSFGGTVKVAGLNAAGKIAYNAAGLAFTGGGGDSIRVTLTEKMMPGTKITVRLQANDTGNRGLKLRKLDKTEVASLGWSSATVGAVESFSYTVVADDGLDGKQAFILSRNNTVYLKYISVENCAPEEFVVTYMDGESTMGTENVYSGYHPTAAGIVTRKSGYAFEGWKETVDGAVKALNTITITADKTLYAEYSARDCSGNGVMFSQVAKANTLESDYSLSGTTEVSIGEYATVTGGEVYLNNNSSNTRVKITKTTSVIQLTSGDDGYIHVLLDCPLKTGDTIKADNTNKWVIAHNASKTDKVQLASGVHHFIVPSTWNNKGEFYIWRDGSSCNISTIKVIRPAKYTVSFNMKGHGSAIADIENVLEGSKISAPSPAPTDEDYAFSGWYKENTLENEWDFANDVVTDDTELFAKWLDKSDATLKSLKYGDTEIDLTTGVLEEGVYVFAVNVSPLATGVPALTAETSNPNASAAITNATEFDGERHATSTVVVTPEKSGAATKTYKVNFTKLQLYTELVDVTDHTEWSWAGVATDEVKINDVANRGLILANYIDAPNFEKLEGEANARAYRSTTYPAYQGTYLRFHATKPGKLTINARNSSGSPKLYVNGGDPVATLTSTRTDYTVIVPAGDVIITSTDGEIRIYNMTYKLLEELTPDYERTTTEGRYGTICLPKAGVMVGASIFEIAYFDVSSSKIFFDEIVNGVMEAGVPYIFLPREGATQLGVYYTDAVNAPAGTYYTDGTTPASTSKNGLVGFIGEAEDDYFDIPDGVGNYIIQNNQYREVPAGAWARVKSNRAYIHFADVPTNVVAPLPGRRRMSIGLGAPQNPTGMDELNAADAPVKVMINGELFILRGEKMYDATGRLVK